MYQVNDAFTSPRKEEEEKSEVEWIGAGVHGEGKTYYRTAILRGDIRVSIGKTILLQPADSSIPPYVAQAVAQWDGQKENENEGEVAESNNNISQVFRSREEESEEHQQGNSKEGGTDLQAGFSRTSSLTSGPMNIAADL